MALWLEAGLDPLGGAHGFLDRRFRPVHAVDAGPFGPSGEVLGDQSLVQQARHLYACSLYAERRGSASGRGDPRAATFAHALYRHLTTVFDAGDVLLHVRTRDGRVRERAVQMYAQGFGIYALATYGRVFDVAAATEQALARFLYLDGRLYDQKHGGYDQREDGGWLPFVSAPPGTVKCANTHIHALETSTALLRALPVAHSEHSLVRARTSEMAQLIATRLRQPAGYLAPFFDQEWRPVGPPRVSYGHDVETAWLLVDALDALMSSGEVSEELGVTVRRSAIDLTRHALRTGWDPAGGFFDHGVPEGAAEPARVQDHGKVWWAQVEALPGLYRIWRLTGDESLIARLERVLQFISEKSWDQEYGGYFWGVDQDGRPLGRGEHKGEFWKTPYHDVRACLLTADWIEEDLRLGLG